MMLNKLPANTPFADILDYLSTVPSRFASRNRCMFAMRPYLRTFDIAYLCLRDVINPDDGSITHSFVSRVDRHRFELNALCRAELESYLRPRFGVTPQESLLPVLQTCPNDSVFASQQRDRFSPNTAQQLFSQLSKIVDRHFSAVQQKM
jgi:hypothetical protein